MASKHYYNDEKLSGDSTAHGQYVSDFNAVLCQEDTTRELKVDKRILQVMQRGLFFVCLSFVEYPFLMFAFAPGGNQEIPSSETFCDPIRNRGVHVDFSSSFRDRQGNEIPIVRVTCLDHQELERACATIMEYLDPHRD